MNTIDLFSDNKTEYAFLTGKVKAMETRLPDTAFFENLLSSSNLAAAVETLRRTDYAGFITDPLSWEEGAGKYYGSVLSLLSAAAPRRELTGLIRLRYDFHNMKTLFRQKTKLISDDGQDYFMDFGNVKLETLREAVFNETYSRLPSAIARAAKDTQGKISKNDDVNIARSAIISLDRWLYHILVHESENAGSFLRNFFSMLVDVYNIKAFLRAKKLNREKDFFHTYFLHHGTIPKYKFEKFYDESVPDIIGQLSLSPYFDIVKPLSSAWAKDRSLAKIEKETDNFVTKILKRARLKTFGVAPVVAYIWAKEMEVRNLKLVMTALQYGLDKNTVKEYLRDI